MNTHEGKLRVLGIASIVMITVGSVDSIRNLPATALFGSKLVFFFMLGALFFLLPCALVSAELASTWSDEGGVYSWVKEAFGKKTGFFAIWFQWIENVIWYPAILSFVAGTVGYLFAPQVAGNKYFLIAVILTCFWGMTYMNSRGIETSARFSNFCAFAGLLLPMTLIILLGIIWVGLNEPVQIGLNLPAFLPNLHAHGDQNLWVALTGIILSFCGMEIATVHGANVKNPQRAYPIAMLVATLIIIVTLIFGSLAIAIVIPNQQISLVAGIMEAFDVFFKAYHLHWLLPLMAIFLIIGGLGSVNNWIIAPTRGLLYASQDGALPNFLKTTNRFGAPSRLLLYQALIVTLICCVFLLLPSINASYWLLTALAAQLYMFMYILMFASAIYLRIKYPAKKRPYKIPGGIPGLLVVAGAGMLSCVVTIIVGFIPPDNINIGSTAHYEWLLIFGLLLMSVPPLLVMRKQRRSLSNLRTIN